MVDTGSEVNLISEHAAKRAGLHLEVLPKPTIIRLALQENSTKPVVLRHFTSATLTNPNLPLRFPGVLFKVGPIAGDHDMILSTPFLSNFQLSVSLSLESLTCEKSHLSILDCRHPHAMNTCALASVKPALPLSLEERAARVLHKFSDLFPANIPAVSNEAASQGLFTDGSFPKKIQDEFSKTRHKIVLTDPNAVINEQQYPYPGKHLVAWRTLLDQHVDAGQIRCSSSQYASPSMIIPKKDPLALLQWVCDYRVLNGFTIKNRSPLPNVDELL
jgi:hypothetical protein